MTAPLDMMDPLMMGQMMDGAMMFVSMLLARIIGPLFAVMGLGVLLNPGFFRSLMDELAKGKDSLMVYCAGMVSFVLGLFFVGLHNVWVWNWSVIITIIGWVMLIRGVLILLVPSMVIKMIQYFAKQTWWLPVGGIVALILGVVLSYYGFAV